MDSGVRHKLPPAPCYALISDHTVVIARDRATDDNACAATIRRNAHRHVHNKYRIDEAARWSVDADAHTALALPRTVNKHVENSPQGKQHHTAHREGFQLKLAGSWEVFYATRHYR